MKDKTKTLLTGEIQVTPFDSSYNELDRMLFLSKNLYNACLYTERQKFFEKRDSKDSTLKGFLTDFELSKKLQDEDNPDIEVSLRYGDYIRFASELEDLFRDATGNPDLSYQLTVSDLLRQIQGKLS